LSWVFSGTIEEAADSVGLCYSEGYYDTEHAKCREKRALWAEMAVRVVRSDFLIHCAFSWRDKVLPGSPGKFRTILKKNLTCRGWKLACCQIG
jgi:hypothetical protein